MADFSPKTGPRQHRKVDSETLECIPKERQQHYLDWLVNPEKTPATEAEYARQNGVDPKTLWRWRKDPDFEAQWKRKCDELNVSMPRVQAVLDAMFNAATRASDKHPFGDPSAMMKYLEYVGKFTPTRRVIVEDKGIAEMSDAEIADIAGVTRLHAVGE